MSATPIVMAACGKTERASMSRWMSCARWPHKHGFLDDMTTDTHDTRAQAQAVCDILMRDGLGGDRIHFPFETWTQEEPRDTGAVSPSADATDSTVTALLNEAGVLIDSAETYRAGKLHGLANEKIAAALKLIHEAQVMMQREGA